MQQGCQVVGVVETVGGILGDVGRQHVEGLRILGEYQVGGCRVGQGVELAAATGDGLDVAKAEHAELGGDQAELADERGLLHQVSQVGHRSAANDVDRTIEVAQISHRVIDVACQHVAGVGVIMDVGDPLVDVKLVRHR